MDILKIKIHTHAHLSLLPDVLPYLCDTFVPYTSCCCLHYELIANVASCRLSGALAPVGPSHWDASPKNVFKSEAEEDKK